MKWKPHQGITPEVRKFIRCDKINGSFKVLTLQACAYASRSVALYRAPDSNLKKSIFSWVDEEFEIVHKDLQRYKERLYETFSELAKNKARFPLTEKAPSSCPVCGSKLVTAYAQPLVCEHCMQPVLDALDDLIRATTREWTPEGLRKGYQNTLKSLRTDQ